MSFTRKCRNVEKVQAEYCRMLERVLGMQEKITNLTIYLFVCSTAESPIKMKWKWVSWIKAHLCCQDLWVMPEA